MKSEILTIFFHITRNILPIDDKVCETTGNARFGINYNTAHTAISTEYSYSVSCTSLYYPLSMLPLVSHGSISDSRHLAHPGVART